MGMSDLGKKKVNIGHHSHTLFSDDVKTLC